MPVKRVAFLMVAIVAALCNDRLTAALTAQGPEPVAFEIASIKPNRQLGPQLRATQTDCAALNKAAGGPMPPAADGGPTLFTALQEQLGLKLESTRGHVEVMVVERVDRPTPD